MDIVLYNFSKNNNSTKMPVGDGHRLTGCNIKEPCSVITPTIILSAVADPYDYNYCYVPKFKRYYYINNYIYNAGRWNLDCVVDVLATYRSNIGSSTQYILRSAYTYDGTICDMRYPATSNVEIVTSGVLHDGGEDPLPAVSPPDGVYIVGIVSPESGAIGPTAYYQMTNSQFRSFCNAMLSNADWVTQGLEEISTELAKIILNPFQYVVSCMWFPKEFADGGSSQITIGWWTLPVSASKLGQTTRLISFRFNVPKHPQSGRGSYLNNTPYSRYTLFWPAVGQIPLDPAKVAESSAVICQCYVDAVSGGAVFSIFDDKFNTLFTSQITIGVNIQLAQVATDYLGSGVQLINSVVAGATGNVLGAINGIGNAIGNMFPQVSVQGKNGMTSVYNFGASLQCEFYRVAEDDNTHIGRPLCQKRQISEIPGYMEIANPELEISGSENELQEIKSFMTGGFYYE